MTYLTVTILRVLGINNHGHFTVLYVFLGMYLTNIGMTCHQPG